MRLRDTLGAALAAGALLLATGCVLPVRLGPEVRGTVVDATTGVPLAGAIVVVRYDARPTEELPDRQHLAHAETRTGADGSFRLPRFRQAGLTIWPIFRTEARVASVLASGYRCPVPMVVEGSGPVRIDLDPALDLAQQRQSCRPVASRRGETEVYRTAWRALFPAPETPEERAEKRQLARTLEARAAFGFGANCEGPVSDLALAPGGARAAFVTATDEGEEVRLVELSPEGPGDPKLTARLGEGPRRRLAWTDPGELVLWQPTAASDRTLSPSIFASGEPEILWADRPRLPTRLGGERRLPLDPADLSDEGDALWRGRSFSLERVPDPATGRARDRLEVTRDDGTRHAVDLPGEACGGARYGRPHYRIAAGGRLGIDLRFVGAGCHAVAIDLESGEWEPIDRSERPATCRAQRRIPPNRMEAALRGWMRELRVVLDAAGADPRASYSLRISEGNATRVHTRTLAGEPLQLAAPPFPVETPLRRIEVTRISPLTPGFRNLEAPADLAPEPL